MPLPDNGPTTDVMVKAYLGITDPDAGEVARLDLVVPAVNAVVRELPVVANLDDHEEEGAEDEIPFPEYVIHGATMLAALFYRRYNSPDGVASISPDQVIYVTRNDPQIAELLQLGSRGKPAVG